jgi:hypothetical protein
VNAMAVEQLFRNCDAERFAVVNLITRSDLVGCLAGRSAGFAQRGDRHGLSAWHIILVLAQPRRKRDPDPPMREAPALGEIVEDHLGRVLIGDS